MLFRVLHARRKEGGRIFRYTFIYADGKLCGRIIHEDKNNGKTKYIISKNKYYFNHKKAVKSIIHSIPKNTERFIR